MPGSAPGSFDLDQSHLGAFFVSPCPLWLTVVIHQRSSPTRRRRR